MHFDDYVVSCYIHFAEFYNVKIKGLKIKYDIDIKVFSINRIYSDYFYDIFLDRIRQTWDL